MIRLYGISIGNGSLARVTQGMRYALERLGLLAGFVPCDAYNEDDIYGGHDADVAVLVGGNMLPLATNIGWHKRIWVLVPPNSTWVPHEPLRRLHKAGAGVISPSEWGELVLRENAAKAGVPDLKVSTWHHGVVESFAPRETAYRAALDAYRRGGCFDVLHMASEASQRKGTRELLRAWAAAVGAGQLGRAPTLRLVVDGPRGTFDRVLDATGAPQHVLDTVVWTDARPNLSAVAVAAFYRAHHAVCQPSRGEGWGMVPQEARACGVPVVMTDCTGHGSHALWGATGVAPTSAPGVVIVPTGPYAEIDDGPDGQAPALDEADVRAALVSAYARWPQLARESVDYATEFGRAWSWVNTTKAWLASIGES